MREEETVESLEICPLCGKQFPAAELIWSSRQQSFICQPCLSEEESCGCEDG